MEQIIDPVLLVKALMNPLIEEESDGIPEAIRYLIKKLLDAMLADEWINIDKLDYDAFELEDIDDFETFINEKASRYTPIKGMIMSVSRIPAKCGNVPAFC